MARIAAVNDGCLATGRVNLGAHIMGKETASMVGICFEAPFSNKFLSEHISSGEVESTPGEFRFDSLFRSSQCSSRATLSSASRRQLFTIAAEGIRLPLFSAFMLPLAIGILDFAAIFAATVDEDFWGERGFVPGGW